MTIEETIRASAHRIADEVEPPGLDIELIRSRIDHFKSSGKL